MADINSPNIVIMVLDTLRKDYYEKYLSQTLQKFGFVYYPNAIAPSPWTIPSHASIVTGLYPALHGAHETPEKKDTEIKLHKHELSFINNLSEKGYQNFLLSSNIYVSPYFGFWGFNKFIDTSIPRVLSEDDVKLFSSIIYRTNRRLLPTLKAILKEKEPKLLLKMIVGYGLRHLQWPKDKGATNTVHHLEELLILNTKKAPLFIMMNLLEVHEPYARFENVSELRESNRKGHPPSEKVIKRWQHKYPKQVKYLKNKLVDIIKLLKDFEIFENSIIIVTSDHGQMLGEYGVIGHGTYLYDELLRVPLAIKYPENKKVVITEQRNTNYISLTKIKPLILQTVYSTTIDDSILYSPIVFAESYGIPERIRPMSKEEQEYVNSLEKYKIAVYSNGKKAVFNVADWKFEEYQQDNSQIKKAIIRFLKTATVTKVPKMKL
ncbi:MAG: sulfatase-like hydrolase/transferase [Candidatus Marinimicrobia bacterium]|nr:sulfatase-like hydrolase/transferase [Candidatus Neomarinimicrobiota bacterium]